MDDCHLPDDLERLRPDEAREAIRCFLSCCGDRITILHGLTAEEKESLARHLRRVRYPADTVCITEGERIGYLGLIVSGRLEIRKEIDLPGKKIVLAVLGPGSHVGDFSIWEDRPSHAGAIATEAVELLLVDRAGLDAFVDEHPRGAVKMLKGIAGVLEMRLQKAIEKVVRLST